MVLRCLRFLSFLNNITINEYLEIFSNNYSKKRSYDKLFLLDVDSLNNA